MHEIAEVQGQPDAEHRKGRKPTVHRGVLAHPLKKVSHLRQRERGADCKAQERKERQPHGAAVDHALAVGVEQMRDEERHREPERVGLRGDRQARQQACPRVTGAVAAPPHIDAGQDREHQEEQHRHVHAHGVGVVDRAGRHRQNRRGEQPDRRLEQDHAETVDDEDGRRSEARREHASPEIERRLADVPPIARVGRVRVKQLDGPRRREGAAQMQDPVPAPHHREQQIVVHAWIGERRRIDVAALEHADDPGQHQRLVPLVHVRQPAADPPQPDRQRAGEHDDERCGRRARAASGGPDRSARCVLRQLPVSVVIMALCRASIPSGGRPGTVRGPHGTIGG